MKCAMCGKHIGEEADYASIDIRDHWCGRYSVITCCQDCTFSLAARGLNRGLRYSVRIHPAKGCKHIAETPMRERSDPAELFDWVLQSVVYGKSTSAKPQVDGLF